MKYKLLKKIFTEDMGDNAEYDDSISLKLTTTLSFLITLSISMYITYNFRPWVYDMQLTQYYYYVGALPSFMSVVVIYYCTLSYFAFKNKKFTTYKNTIIIFILIVNILYELFVSRVYDNADILAILIGGVFIYIVEKIKFSVFKCVKQK